MRTWEHLIGFIVQQLGLHKWEGLVGSQWARDFSERKKDHLGGTCFLWGKRWGRGLMQIASSSWGGAESELHCPKPDLMPDPLQLLRGNTELALCVVSSSEVVVEAPQCVLWSIRCREGSAVVRGRGDRLWGCLETCMCTPHRSLPSATGSCKTSAQVVRGSPSTRKLCSAAVGDNNLLGLVPASETDSKSWLCPPVSCLSEPIKIPTEPS